MKKLLFSIIFTLISVSLFAQHEILLTLDFNAPQDNPPKEDYAAAFLINTNNIPLLFEASTIVTNYSWTGLINCNSFFNSRDTRIMDVIMDASVYGENYSMPSFVLKPGERVIVWSRAFTMENRMLYPYSELTGIVYFENDKRIIKAYLYYKLPN